MIIVGTCCIHGTYGDDVMRCCCALCVFFFVVGESSKGKKFKFGKRLEKNTQQYPDAPCRGIFTMPTCLINLEPTLGKYSLHEACGIH